MKFPDSDIHTVNWIDEKNYESRTFFNKNSAMIFFNEVVKRPNVLEVCVFYEGGEERNLIQKYNKIQLEQFMQDDIEKLKTL